MVLKKIKNIIMKIKCNMKWCICNSDCIISGDTIDKIKKTFTKN